MLRVIALVLAVSVPAYADRATFDAAKKLHADAQAKEKACASCAVPLFETAQRAWADYVKRFANAPDVVEAHFFNAEILYFKLAKLEEAGDEYMIVARSKPVGPMHRDALVNAIDAFDRSRSPQPGPIDRKLLEAADLYAALFNGGPDMVGIIFKLGKLESDHGHFDEAMKKLMLIVTKYPKAPESGPAADLALDAANRAKDYQAMWDLTQMLAKHPAFQSPDRLARLAAIRAGASAKLAEREADGGRFAKAAELYERAASESQPKDAVRMLENAAVSFERARLADRAIATYRAIVDKFPNDGARALGRIAHIEEALLHWDRAAEAYEQLAARDPSGLGTADALYNIAVLRAALGERDRAIAAAEKYVRAFPSRADVPQVALFAAKLREENGDLAGALRAYVAITDNRKLGLEARVGAARVAVMLGRDAEPQLTAAIALGKQLHATRLLAEALLWRARLAMRSADRVKLDGAQLSRALASKTKLWAAADRLFDDVIAAGDVDVAITALRDKGESREQLASAIENLPAPQGLTAEQVAAHRRQLQQFAGAMRTQALEIYLAAHAKALQLASVGVDTSAIRQALVRLGALPGDAAREPLRSSSPPTLEMIR